MKVAHVILVIPSLIWPAIASYPATQSAKKPVPKVSSGETGDEWALRGRLLANPNDRKAHEALCSILEKRNDHRRLVAERKAWLENNPQDWSELILLTTDAQIFLQDPQYAIDAARRFLSRLDSENEHYGWANDFLGRQLVARDKLDEAISLFKAALKAEPDREDYLEHLGVALVKAGQIDAGVAALKKAIGLNPTSVDLHSELADAFGKKGDTTGEETEYSAACNLLSNLHKNDPIYSKEISDPALSSQLTRLARVQIEHGKYTEADETLNRAIKADSQIFYAYLLRARLLEQKKQPKEAEVQRQRAKDLLTETMKKEKDNSLSTLSEPLVMFVLLHEDAQEVARIYRTSTVPLTTADHGILAAVYFEIGQAENAVTEFNKLLTADQKSDDPKIYFGFAELLKRAKLKQKAEEYYRKAYEMDPENVTYLYEYEAIKQANTSSR